MNMQRYLSLIVAGLAVSFGDYAISAHAEVTAKEVGRQAAQAADSGATYAGQERDRYIRDAQKEVDDLRAGIERLGSRARTARDDMKAKLDRDIAALDGKRDAAESKLAELRSANASAWKHLKAGMDSALQDLQQSFARARKEFE